MDYTTLGNSGCAVSTLALGTMTFGSETDEEGAYAQLDRFVEAGGTLVDTADVYSGGVTEEIIGRWLADRPADLTEPVVLATKGRFPMGTSRTAPGCPTATSPARSTRRCAGSDVDSVDLYQAHAYDALHPARGDAAHVRRLHPGRQDPLLRPVQLHRLAADQGGPPRPGAQRRRRRSPCSRSTTCWSARPSGRSCRPRSTPGVGLLPWSPLGGGWLSGKYRRDERPTGDTRLGDNPERGMEAYDRRNGVALHLGHHRGRAGRGRAARRVHGPGGAGLGHRPAVGHLDHPRRAHPRAARGQPRRRRPGARRGRGRRRSTGPAIPAPRDYPYGPMGVAPAQPHPERRPSLTALCGTMAVIRRRPHGRGRLRAARGRWSMPPSWSTRSSAACCSAFTDSTGSPGAHYVGLRQYRTVQSDPAVQTALVHTLEYVRRRGRGAERHRPRPGVRARSAGRGCAAP